MDLAQKRIVILEDHSASGLTITQLLNDQNFTLVPALGIDDLLHRLHRDRVDMIVIDASIPEFSDPSEIRTIRSRFKRRQVVPILVALDQREEALLQKFVSAGITDIFAKPYVAAEVINRIQGYLRAKFFYDGFTETSLQLARERENIGLVLRELHAAPPEGIPGWQFAIRHQASSVASGDFYDVVTLPDGRVAVAIADVLGRGIHAAMRVSMAKAILHSQLPLGTEPGAVLEMINGVLLDSPTEDPFMTIYLAVLDPSSGQIVQSTAGHPGPVLQNTTDHLEIPEVAGGPPIGVLSDARYESNTIRLAPGTRMFLGTNGLWDQRNAVGACIGIEHFLELLHTTAALPDDAALDMLMASAMTFADGSQPQDDMTLLLVSRAS